MTKHVQTKTLSLLTLILVGVLMLGSGCVHTPVSDGSQLPTTATSNSPVLDSQKQSNSSSNRTPTRNFGRYVVFDDKSRSVRSGRISPLNEQDITVLIDILRVTGGELAFGVINESSDRPLLRLRISTPPTPPDKLEIQNPFERAEEEASYQEKMGKYRESLSSWQLDTNKRVNNFIAALKPRLQLKSIATASDVWSALRRSELFLNEPTLQKATSDYVILNTDGLDTVNSPPTELKRRSKLLLINGAGISGVLAPLHPIRFESAQAALLYISQNELGGTQ